MMALTGGFSHHILIAKSRGLGWRLALRAKIRVTDNNSAGSQAVAAVTGPRMALKRKTRFWAALTDWARAQIARTLDRSTGEEQVGHPVGRPTTERSEIQEISVAPWLELAV